MLRGQIQGADLPSKSNALSALFFLSETQKISDAIANCGFIHLLVEEAESGDEMMKGSLYGTIANVVRACFIKTIVQTCIITALHRLAGTNFIVKYWKMLAGPRFYWVSWGGPTCHRRS